MKKIAILSILLLFAITVMQAQETKTEKKTERKTERKALRKLKGNEVSQMAKTNFNVDFGKVQNAVWKRNGTYDEAAFTQDGKKKTAFYDENSTLVGTTQVKTFSDLPAKAQQDIKKKFKDYKIGTVIFYDDNEANDTDMIMYGTQFDDADNYFVEVTKANKTTVLQVTTSGDVIYFANL